MKRSTCFGGYGSKSLLAARSQVQRIVYAENETNYCPRCQAARKTLADRSLSKDDWLRSIDKLESIS